MEQVLGFLLTVFIIPFELMSQIEFLGTNLFQFSVSLLVIGVMLPIVISLGKSILVGTNKSDVSGGKNG